MTQQPLFINWLTNQPVAVDLSQIQVAAFGICTQNADISAIVRAALNTIPAGGSTPFTVVFPDGVYNIGSTVDLGLRNRVTLKCQSPGSCILFLSNGANCDMFTSGDNSTYVTGVGFENLYLDGNRTNQTAGTALVNFKGVEFPTFRSGYIRNAYNDGILFDGGSRVSAFPRVYHCILDNAGQHNIHFGQNSFGGGAVGNTIRTAGARVVGSAGIFGFANAETQIIGNDLDANNIQILLTGVARYTITGNFGLNSVQNAVKMTGTCQNNTIAGNNFMFTGTGANATYNGCEVSGDHNTITGNIFAGTSALSTMANGIIEVGSSDANMIAGNLIEFSSTLIATIGVNTFVSSSNPFRLKGTITNDNATAGDIGEIIESSIAVGSAVALSNNTTANVTSISLTAGDWDVWGAVFFHPAATTNITFQAGAVSTTSATIPTNPNGGATTERILVSGQVPNFDEGFPVGTRRLSLSATTTVFLVAQSNFSVSTNAAYGYLGARRVR